MAGMSSLVRIVNAGVPGSQDRVDVVLRDGVVASVGPAGTVSASDSTMQTKAHTTSLEYATNAIASGSVSIPTSAAAPADETTIDADGLWVIPGLWDCHTHFTQWAKTLGRLDLINARSAAEAMDMLRRHLDERRAADTLDPDAFVVGMRFRHSLWADDEQPTLAAIDAVTGEQPVALSSADGASTYSFGCDSTGELVILGGGYTISGESNLVPALDALFAQTESGDTAS